MNRWIPIVLKVNIIEVEDDNRAHANKHMAMKFVGNV